RCPVGLHLAADGLRHRHPDRGADRDLNTLIPVEEPRSMSVERPVGGRAHAVLGIASVGVALAAADTYVVVLALTDMMAGVGVTIDALQKATPIISGFLLGYIAILPLIGRVADLVARQRVLQLCLA